MGIDETNDFLSTKQLDLNYLIKLNRDADEIEKLMTNRAGRELLTRVLPGYVIGEIFFQESSRTFHSFASSGLRLGANVVSERGVKRTKKKNGKKITTWELVFSSLMKDAWLEDEVKAWGACYDLLIFRTHDELPIARIVNALRQRNFFTGPIVNGGDGRREHPTQTAGDVRALLGFFKFNIERDWRKLSSMPVAFINDCKNARVIHSLAWTLGAVLKMPLLFIAPPGLEMPPELLKDLDSAGVRYTQHNDLQPAPVYYVTRLQKEYFKNSADFKKYRQYFSITKKIADKFGVEAVMHPLPRSKAGNELPIWLPDDPTNSADSLDGDKRALYFYQMQVAIPTRMAILKNLLNPHLDLKKLQEEKLIRGLRSQCAGCNRVEYHELGWTEFPPQCGYIQTLPHIFCPKCQPRRV